MEGPDDDRVLTTITAHAASMLAIARTHSLCLDDALDAYQRTLEIFLRKADEVRPATAGEWLRTVAKHEAIRLRDQRQRLVGGDAVEWELRQDPDAREPAEHAVAMERVAQAAEALQACKRDESKAILLKAGGASYAEIAAREGWTATKTNRVLTEGRRTFMERFAAIETGQACSRYAPLLSAVADGEATPEDYVALRPHLRHCAGCRETLRGLYDAQPALGALVPAGLVVAAAGSPALEPELPVRLLGRLYEALVTSVGDKLVRVQALVEAATSTKAGVVAATAAVAAGGAVAAVGPTTPTLPAPGPTLARVAPAPSPLVRPGKATSGARRSGAERRHRRGAAQTHGSGSEGRSSGAGRTIGRTPPARRAAASSGGSNPVPAPSPPAATPAPVKAAPPAPAAASTAAPRQSAAATEGEFGFER